MKNLIIISMLMVIHLSVFGQGVGINQSGILADPNAMLNINSTTNGIFLLHAFRTAFSSPPSVYIGNVVSGSILGLTMDVEDVTTTGCTLVLGNYTPYDFTIVASQYKIIAIGAE